MADSPDFEWQVRFDLSFLRSPEWLALDPTTRVVFSALYSRADSLKHTCRPSHATLAKDAGVSHRSVINALHKLKAAQFIHIRKRGKDGMQLPNLYTIVRWPDSVSKADASHDRGANPARGGVQILHTDNYQKRQLPLV